ncbi:hypothetical protein L596_019641 [Steinernema carpocapsae]|uniref:Uncharacterized protein n=1 Tax=Steinernema carpocapsae TaxID=34508 RepID=A0A4U5MRB9_STECR|nr:hypothetical protein L596_019641 [Steinernema carpocapsae]
MDPLYAFLMFTLNTSIFLALPAASAVFCFWKKSSPDKKLTPSPSPPKMTKSEDTFDQHKPVKREVRRAAEITKGQPVDGKRDDYKTFNKKNMPESDFDKTL